MKLVLAAFWTHETAEAIAAVLHGHTVPGSGAVVDMTASQVNQPRLRNTLRMLNLDEAADFKLPDASEETP